MNKVNLLTRAQVRVRKTVSSVHLPVEAVTSLVILFLILVIMSVTLVRKVQESGKNYEVYQQELTALDDLQAENEQLRRELAYYNSIEYKLLYARDSLNTTRPGERLYELSDEIVLYDYEPEQVSMYDQLDLKSVWWSLLFGDVL